MATTIRRGTDRRPEVSPRALGRIGSLTWWQQVLIVGAMSIGYTYVAGFFIGAELLASRRGWGEGVPGSIRPVAASLPDLFVRWDGGYYLVIAERGYPPGGEERAFFPLYPITVGALSRLFALPAPWIGMVVSALAFIAAGLVLYRWMRLDYSHEEALLATAVMYLSPVAFFFVAFYGEPLLLLASVASLYFARRGRFLASGIAVALAGAARPTAFLLAIPYVVEFVQQRDFSRPSLRRFIGGGLLAPTGFVSYILYLYLATGALPMASGGSWKTYYTWPWEVIYDGLNAAIAGTGIAHDWFSRTLAWHDLLYAILALALSIWAIRHLRRSAALFVLLGTLFLYSTHGPEGYAFWSIARRLAVMVPFYVVVAALLAQRPRAWRVFVLSLSVALLGVLSAWFVSGRWVS